LGSRPYFYGSAATPRGNRVLAVASQAKGAADAELNVVLQFGSLVDAQVGFVSMSAFGT
jgi:hypothetical protein